MNFCFDKGTCVHVRNVLNDVFIPPQLIELGLVLATNTSVNTARRCSIGPNIVAFSEALFVSKSPPFHVLSGCIVGAEIPSVNLIASGVKDPPFCFGSASPGCLELGV